MGWRALFWTASGISVLLRALLPESAVFLKASASSGTARKISLPDRPIHSFPTGRNRRWRVHGVAPAVLGAVYHNCRFTSLTAVFTPSGSYPRASARSPPAPSAYSSARDVIPIHLVEMAPPACRATCPAARKRTPPGGDHLQVPGRVDGKPGMVPDYTKVQGILIGVVAAFVVFVTVVGPENHGSARTSRSTARGSVRAAARTIHTLTTKGCTMRRGVQSATRRRRARSVRARRSPWLEPLPLMYVMIWPVEDGGS
ncbi:hypothetical protein C8J57DRAFT_58178 [Mycena rebaudengoi]|nr:hypothetical protein C8J57DRAFT_58178 [Mycena rebaudengoi]